MLQVFLLKIGKIFLVCLKTSSYCQKTWHSVQIFASADACFDAKVVTEETSYCLQAIEFVASKGISLLTTDFLITWFFDSVLCCKGNISVKILFSE